MEEWRDLDRRLVDAQEARRILDRLYGYEVSPVLWKKVMPRLSAGRVQSVATRMIVERERARMRFRAATWWDLEGTFDADGQTSPPTWWRWGARRWRPGATSPRPESSPGPTWCSWARPRPPAWCRASAGQTFTVRAVTEKPYRRSPAPPFMTSTLQQEASRKLRFGAQRTMQVAQRLYEQGWITYMRTDSTTLSDEALTAARAQASALYGREYVPDAPRRYERKVKNAQEAHEAIRPAGEAFRTPDEAGRELHGDALRLYDLIWKRTVASQMADATGTSAQVRLVGDAGGWRRRPTRPSSRRRARSSGSPGSCGPTSKAPTTPTPRSPSATCSSRRSPRATRSRPRRSRRAPTPPNRRPATPRRRS